MSARINNAEMLDGLHRVRKDAITAGKALNAYGKRNPKIWERFLRKTCDLTGLSKYCEVIYDDSPLFKAARIEPGKRLGMAGKEATAALARSGIRHSEMEITPREAVIGVEVTAKYLRDNIEGAAAAKTIVQDLFMPSLGNEVEETIMLSNALGVPIKESDRRPDGSESKYVKDSLLSMGNGVLKIAQDSGTRYDGDLDPISELLLMQMRTALDVRFTKLADRLAYLSDSQTGYHLRYKRSQRQGGEKHFESETTLPVLGAPFEGLKLWPHNPVNVQHFALSSTTPVALEFKNATEVLVFAQTSMSAESAVSPYSDTTDYVVVTNETTGVTTVARRGGTAIGDGDVVKVSYKTAPRVLHTFQGNLVLVFNPRGTSIKYDEDIFSDTWQCAIRTIFGWGVKFPEGIVDLYDIADGI